MKRLELFLFVATAWSTFQLNSGYYLAEQSRIALPNCLNEIYKTKTFIQNIRREWMENSTIDRCRCNPSHLNTYIEFIVEDGVLKGKHYCIDCECLRNKNCAIPVPQQKKTLYNGICFNPACGPSDICRLKFRSDQLGELLRINLCNCGSDECTVYDDQRDTTLVWYEYRCTSRRN